MQKHSVYTSIQKEKKVNEICSMTFYDSEKLFKCELITFKNV